MGGSLDIGQATWAFYILEKTWTGQHLCTIIQPLANVGGRGGAP